MERVRAIHFFDIAIVGVSLAVLFGFFFFFYRKSEYITIRAKVTDQEILYENASPRVVYAQQFTIGDTERDAVGRIVTEVVGVDILPISLTKRAVYLDLRVRATYDTRTHTYAARGKTLMYGTPMRFSLQSVMFDGFIVGVQGSKISEGTGGSRKISLLVRAMEPKFAEKIKVGDQVKNQAGEVLLEVKKVQIRPAQQVTQTVSGELLLKSNPLYKDVELEIDVQVMKIHDDLFVLGDLPLKVGSLVPFVTEGYAIEGFVTEVEENK